MFTVYTIILLNCVQNKINNSFNDVQSIVYGIQGDIANINNNILDMYNQIDDLQNTTASLDTKSNISSNTSLPISSNTHSNISDKREEQGSSDNDGIYDDMYNMYHGRLHIPNLNISVALYYSNKTYVTDRYDSANIFAIKNPYNYVIGDHNNQEFSKLYGVKVGMTGYIELKDGEVVNIRCFRVLNGHNVVSDLTDASYNSITGIADYTLYTCRDNWKNVLICLWDITQFIRLVKRQW